MKFWFQFVMLFSLILVACNPVPGPTAAHINKPITTAVNEAVTIVFPTKPDGSEALLQAQASGLMDDLI